MVPEEHVQAATAAVPSAPRPLLEQEKEQPKKKMIKLSHPGPSKISAQSPAPPLAPVSRQPSIAVAAPARPTPELERGDSISVQNRPTVKLPSAPQSVVGTPTPEPSRQSISNSKVTKLSKKRKLAETETASVPRRSKIVTLRYGQLREHKRQQVARIPSSKAKAIPPADSIVATPVARAIPATASPSRQGSSPANVDVSMISTTSTLSADSSSTAQPSHQQKTPLPNGKMIRKPLPTGPSLHGAGSPTSSIAAKPSATTRQPSQSQQPTSASPSRRISPVASRSSTEPASKPKKLVKLKLKLGGNRSLAGPSSNKPPPPPPTSGQK